MLYQKIKQLCSDECISVYQLEKILGFSRGSIDKWKSSTPAADKLQKVATYFSVTVEHLLEGD